VARKLPDAKGRNIASMVAHIHNVRLMWLKAGGRYRAPAEADSETVTKQQAVRALEASWKASRNARHGLAWRRSNQGLQADVASFFAYLVAHDGHHRGQMTMLARQVGMRGVKPDESSELGPIHENSFLGPRTNADERE